MCLHIIVYAKLSISVIQCTPLSALDGYNVSSHDKSYLDVIDVTCHGNVTTTHVCSKFATWKPDIPACKGMYAKIYITLILT